MLDYSRHQVRVVLYGGSDALLDFQESRLIKDRVDPSGTEMRLDEKVCTICRRKCSLFLTIYTLG